MKFRLFLTVLLVLFVVSISAAQKKTKPENDQDEYDENFEFKDTKTVSINIGLGLGIDYGGVGAKLIFLPTPHVGVFAGVGYNLLSAGYNFGAMYRLKPDGKACPYASIMYGYNAVIVVDGLDEYNDVYYGTSLGAGVELKRKKNKFWNFELVIPFRSSDYRRDLDALKANPNVETTDPLPFQISVGYHFPL